MAVKLVLSGERFEAITESPADRFAPKQAGFRWDPDRKVWWTRDSEIACKLRDLATPDLRASFDQQIQERKAAIEASRSAVAVSDLPIPDGLEYMPFQSAGIAIAAKRDATLFGDEMGLGKTIQAIGTANTIKDLRRVLVICPASLRLNWRNEWNKWTVHRDLSVGVAVGKKWPGTHVVICNYDILGNFAAILRETEWDLIVVDEAHYLKNPKTQRTAEVFGKWEKIDGAWKRTVYPLKARVRLALTGTPIPNRPIEIQPVLGWLAPDIWGSRSKFATRYCGAHWNGWGWDDKGASNLEELQDRLRATVMVRRQKSEVLKELPPKVRQVVEVQADGEAARLVRAQCDLHDQLEKRLFDLRLAVELAKAGDSEKAYEDAVLALTTAHSKGSQDAFAVAQEVGLAKVDHVVRMVVDALEEDDSHKVVIFAVHKSVVAKLVDGLSKYHPVKITGDTENTEARPDRQRAVERFQSDPHCRVFVGNIIAAGVGITLTASSHVVMAELDWVPGNISQAEDRCHRIGQVDSVLVQHVVFEGSIDAQMVGTLIRKQKIADAALDKGATGATFEKRVEVPTTTPRYEAATMSSSRTAIAAEAEKMTPEQIAAVHLGLRMIAGFCDGAQELDGMGFSKIDVQLGHSLAAATRLTPKQAALGRKLVVKYQRQVGADVLRATGFVKKGE